MRYQKTPPGYDKAVGDRILLFCDLFGVSQKLVAEESGLSYPYLNRVIRGRRGLSAFGLARVLLGTHTIMRKINWNRRNEYQTWMMGTLKVVASLRDMEDEDGVLRIQPARPALANPRE